MVAQPDRRRQGAAPLRGEAAGSRFYEAEGPRAFEAEGYAGRATWPRWPAA